MRINYNYLIFVANSITISNMKEGVKCICVHTFIPELFKNSKIFKLE